MTYTHKPLLSSMYNEDFAEENFHVSSSNREAHAMVSLWPLWEHPIVVLFGSSGVGKSHLGQIWSQKSNATVIRADRSYPMDAQNILLEESHLLVSSTENQRALLYGINQAINCPTKSIMLLSKTPPSYWSLALPDLSSRLKAATIIALHKADDALLRTVAKKMIAHRQIAMSQQALTYLLQRIERSIDTVGRCLEHLDKMSLERKCPVSIKMIKDMLLEWQHI